MSECSLSFYKHSTHTCFKLKWKRVFSASFSSHPSFPLLFSSFPHLFSSFPHLRLTCTQVFGSMFERCWNVYLLLFVKFYCSEQRRKPTAIPFFKLNTKCVPSSVPILFRVLVQNEMKQTFVQKLSFWNMFNFRRDKFYNEICPLSSLTLSLFFSLTLSLLPHFLLLSQNVEQKISHFWKRSLSFLREWKMPEAGPRTVDQETRCLFLALTFFLSFFQRWMCEICCPSLPHWLFASSLLAFLFFAWNWTSSLALSLLFSLIHLPLLSSLLSLSLLTHLMSFHLWKFPLTGPEVSSGGGGGGFFW